MNFNQILKKLMDERDFSNYRLAKISGFSQSTVKYWLDGTSEPQNRTIASLANIFEVPEAYLLGKPDEYGLTPDDWAMLGELYKAERERRGKSLDFCAEGDVVTADQLKAFENGAGVLSPRQITVICGSLGLVPEDVFFGYAKKFYSSEKGDGEDNEKSDSFSTSEMDLIKKYRGLDDHGKRMVDYVLSEESDRMEQEKEAVVDIETVRNKVIPLFGSAFAAGSGDADFGNFWEDYEVDADSKAEFAVRISGNSMEPYLPDGSIQLAVKRSPKDGEVAALLVDGELRVKQICQDHIGNLYLFSLNRSRQDADDTIWADSERDVKCFGTILMDKPVPLP